MPSAAADLALIAEAAREAGALAMSLRAAGLETEYKLDDSTPVTNADLAADALLKQRLGAARPDYGWLSEETADDPSRLAKRRLFVVDPIDGTRAFMKDRPWWAVSIAVVEDTLPVAGVVFAPQLDETYEATAGGGARLNGVAIAASAYDRVEGCGMVGDPRMFSHPAWPTPCRRCGSRAAIPPPTGYASSPREPSTRPSPWWPSTTGDLAAADLIGREAGAFVGDHTGRSFRYNGPIPSQRSLVCAAPSLAPLILNRVRHIAIGN